MQGRLDLGFLEIDGEDMMDENERTEEAKKKMKEIDTAKEKAEIAKEELVEAAKQSKMFPFICCIISDGLNVGRQFKNI